MKVELPFHSVRMFIFSSYRVDPLLYYGSSIVDCGYSLSRAAYRYSATEEQREQEACTVLLLVLLYSGVLSTQYGGENSTVLGQRRTHVPVPVLRFCLLTTREKHAAFFVEQRRP